MSLMDENGESREDLKVRARAPRPRRARGPTPLSACPLPPPPPGPPTSARVRAARRAPPPSRERARASRSPIQMPTFPDELAPDIRKKHEENEGSVVVTIMSAMGEEHVISAKIDTTADKQGDAARGPALGPRARPAPSPRRGPGARGSRRGARDGRTQLRVGGGRVRRDAECAHKQHMKKNTGSNWGGSRRRARDRRRISHVRR